MSKTTKTFLFALICTVLAIVSSCGVSRVDDIRVMSLGLKSLVFRDVRTYDAVLLVEVKNPAMTIDVLSADGIIYYNDSYFGTFVVDPVTVKGRTTEVYEVPCKCAISGDVSLVEMMSIYSKKSLEGMKIDLTCTVRAKGVTKTGTYKDLDLIKLIGR